MNGTVFLIVELALLFLSISFLVEILQRRLGPERLRAWIGGRPAVAATKGIAVGVITPFCTYSAIPLLVGLRRAGVEPAGYIAFISAAPVLDPILFGALWLIVGPTVAVLYATITFVAAFTVALVAQRIGVERHLVPVAALAGVPGSSTEDDGDGAAVRVDDPPIVDGDACASSSCGPDVEPWRGWGEESRRAGRSSLQLLRSFGPLMLVGVAIGLGIEAFVSPEAASRFTSGSPWLSVPVAAALGTPLYFSTELFVPIANSLENAGVGVGAIVALTIPRAGANVPEFVLLSKLAKPGAVGVFFGYVFGVAVVGGALAHLIAG